MDLDKSLYDSKHPAFNVIYHNLPNYLLSKHRVHRMFFKHCDTDINQYQTCLNDYNWRANIDKYIPDTLQKKCYRDWVKVRRCAARHMGDSFAMKINITRDLEAIVRNEDDIIEQYENLIETKVDMLKELSSEEEEGGEAEEEAEEGGEEEEPSEEGGEAASEEESTNVEPKTEEDENNNKEEESDDSNTADIKTEQSKIPENKDEKQTEQEEESKEKRIQQLEAAGTRSSDITPHNFHDSDTTPTAEDDRKLSNTGQGTSGGGLTQEEFLGESSEMMKVKDAEIVKHPEKAKELNKKDIR